jgi:hypothetical protein
MRKSHEAPRRSPHWFRLAVALLLFAGACGRHEEPGEVTRKRLPENLIAERARRQTSAAAAVKVEKPEAKQILFGDLHVHTTFSPDAFMRSLPLLQGEGTHPPADACDFARFCSQVDFWSINDHAEGISPRHWAETKESIRQCNAVAGDPTNPDVVAFLGWEWTQVGATPEDHYGHKNVIFKDLEDDRVPTRPISALSGRLVGLMRQQAPLWQRLRFPVLDWRQYRRYLDLGVFQSELAKVPACPAGVDSRELPEDCHEAAQTAAELFEKLSQWGFDTIVIPHGNAWGLYTPRGTTWDKQLAGAQHDPDKQTLLEVYSGHGNSEEYRDWRASKFDAAGEPVCPEPEPNFLPCCWQAGEIVRSRCGNAPPEECERRVREARTNFLKAGPNGRQVLPGTPVEQWKDCDHCRDCFNPAFNYRPGGSSQYAMAISNFDEPGAPRRFRFGFIASSDNHTARPGTGYKEYGRRMMSEATGARDQAWMERLTGGPPPAPAEESIPSDPTAQRDPLQALQLVDFERQASFFMTGGLVAVHSSGRDRDAVWSALKRREVYGTSGDRILLWFDLLNAPSGTVPMGSEVRMNESPRFRVRAAGAFKQNPGCPEVSMSSLSPERLEHLCRGECYNPSDERRRITRIEVVRIRPQQKEGEPVRPLIEDPWQVHTCADDPAGCVFEFEDPAFVAGARDVTYYVRAVQEETMAVNAGGLRCEYDEAGNCVQAKPCYGDYRTPFEDDCLSPNEERAWSSPIYVNAQRG